jgi:hypothetical protein
MADAVSGTVEIRWCTTWCPHADQLERLFRLPELERALDMDPVPPAPDSWPLKLAAARAVLGEGRTLVWTDDDAIPGPRVVRELWPMAAAHPRHLRAVAPFHTGVPGRIAVRRGQVRHAGQRRRGQCLPDVQSGQVARQGVR